MIGRSSNSTHDGALGRRFSLLAGATGASNLGDGIFRLALPLVAVGITRSPVAVAGVEAARSLAWPVLALPVGAAADRLDRRHVMIVANGARAALTFAAAALLGFGWESIGLLYAVAVGVGIAEVFSDTAGQSVLPSVVERAELGRANGRLAALEHGAQQFVGPPVVGLLVAVGAGAAFAGTAALWAVAVVPLWCLRGRFRPVRARSSSTVRAEIGQGLRFVAGRPVLRLMAGTVGVANLATSAAGSVLVLFAVGESSSLGLDESHFTLLVLVAAVGGVLGSLLYEPVARRLGRALGLKVAIVGIAVSVGVPAVSSDLWVVTGTMFVGGAAIMLWNVPTVAYRQALTPDHLLGRVNSVYRLVAFGTMPLGALLAGLTAEVFGLRSVFAGSALLTLALLVPVGRLGDAALAEPDDSPGETLARPLPAPSAPV
ncbi:MAG TPA: MFS transporter [Iamia sp.]